MSGTATTPGVPTPQLGRFPVVRMLARGWWVFVLRGAVSILFGILAFLAPGAGLAVMLGFLAAWMAVEGVATLYQAATGGGGGAGAAAPPAGSSRVWLWVDGIVSLLAAALVLFLPVEAAFGLVLLTGIWFVAIGVFRLILAFRMGSVLMGLLGALTVLIGAWLVASPGPGLLALIWLVGLQALFAGVLLIGLGWRLRRIHHDPHGPAVGRG
jgi:uncharacterized membrane protein HdeD (DUF308 family)